MFDTQLTKLRRVISLTALIAPAALAGTQCAASARMGAERPVVGDPYLVEVNTAAKRNRDSDDNDASESDDDAGDDAQRRLAEAEDAVVDRAEEMRERFRQELQPLEADLTLRQLHRNAVLTQIDLAQQARAAADRQTQADIDQRLEAMRSTLRSLDEEIAEIRESEEYRRLRTEHSQSFEAMQRAITRVRDLRTALTPEGIENGVRGLLNAEMILGMKQGRITFLEYRIFDMRRNGRSDSIAFSEALSELEQTGLDLAVLRSLLGATSGGAEDRANLQNTDLISMAPETLDGERLAQLPRVERDSELSRALARNGVLMRVLTREAEDLRGSEALALDELALARQDLAEGEDLDHDERLQLQTEVAEWSGIALAMSGQADLIERRAEEIATAFAEMDSLRERFFQEDTRQALEDDPDDLTGSVQRVTAFGEPRRAAVNAVMGPDDLDALLESDDTWLDQLLDTMPDIANGEGSQDDDPDASVRSEELEADALVQTLLELDLLENLSDASREEPGTAQKLQDARALLGDHLAALAEEGRQVDALLLAYGVSAPSVAQSATTPEIQSEIRAVQVAREALEARLRDAVIELDAKLATAPQGSVARLNLQQRSAALIREREANLRRLSDLSNMALQLDAAGLLEN